jgi:hypothetical protein
MNQKQPVTLQISSKIQRPKKISPEAFLSCDKGIFEILIISGFGGLGEHIDCSLATESRAFGS